MAKEEITIEITLEYDAEKNNNKPARVFLYQFLNRLDREFPILEVGYKGKSESFREQNKNINDIALKKVDSVKKEDIKKPPAWLKDRTIVQREPKPKAR